MTRHDDGTTAARRHDDGTTTARGHNGMITACAHVMMARRHDNGMTTADWALTACNSLTFDTASTLEGYRDAFDL